MMKRILALVLALVLCLGLIGCGEKTEDAAETGIDYDKAFAKHEPNTVVMTVNGEDVTWSEFYYMVFSAVDQMTYYFGDMDWEEEVLEGYGISFNDYCMQLAMDSVKQFHAISKQAEVVGIVLDDADKAKLAEIENAFKQQNVEENTPEAFEAYLMEKLYMTREVYDFVNESSLLYEKLFAEYIGTNGEKLTDGDIQSFIEGMPYVTAKHILIKTVDANGAALPEEEQAAAKAKAEDILAQLKAVKSQKKLVQKFDELMTAHTEDEGTTVFTQGYTFTKDEMYPVFEQAAFALEEYQISDIVESQAGYHILLRLPTTRDSMVDIDYQNNTIYTIATYAATNKYSVLISEWMEGAEIVWNKDFEGITAKEIFE